VSLQDDYFDLSASLRGERKKAFLRIWDAFCDMERVYDKHCEIISSFKRAIRLAFEDESKAEESPSGDKV
jgi:hypothetical protein